MSEINPVPIMAMEPTSMVSSEVHQPDWDAPDATSGSFDLNHDSGFIPSATGSFVLTEDVPIVCTENANGSFVLKEEVPIITDTGNDGSFVLKEQVPIVDTNYTVLPAYVEECVASIAPEQGFTPGEFSIVLDRNSDCEGLIGEIHKATVLEGEREMHLLCKVPPLDPVRKLQFNSVNLFVREIDVYANLLPTMFEFQRQKGVTDELETGFFNVPRCFLTHFDAARDEALILMEDLRVRGFAMWNKMEPINYEHARLLMIQLGRFHALSLAMKDQRPDLFVACKVSDEMLPAMRENEQLMGMFAAALDAAISILDPADEKASWKMNGLRNDFFGVLQNCMDTERAEPYAVLNHGDCWVNNLLFRYKDGAPREVVLVDWQLARYGSPALDLLYFLFCCTDASFREKHYDEMIRIYYTALKDLLEELGSEAVDVFPLTALLRQLKTFGKFAIIMTAVDVPILCTDPTDVHNHGDAAAAFTASADAQQRYAERMGGVIRDAIKYGYL
ncbi:uncharacterized protein LOC131685632 [Topomyia yanbarensis]|uniref:uncharacterized protein LOC131685632 n=1 Tax=Topomyia yanbarensis TaxID=2498891 RepID=UPI00273CBDA1|nr:uncharacterized protein LOC131685632 [Topomyia yanbarensis]